MISNVTSKLQARKELKAILGGLSEAYIENESAKICQHFFDEVYQPHHRNISIFLSMNKEVQTLKILEQLFEMGKSRVYVPKILDFDEGEMKMVLVPSIDLLSSFPKDKWGIPDPPIDGLVEEEEEEMDLVLVPGLGFSEEGKGRLGRGKGFYDSFLSSSSSSLMDEPPRKRPTFRN